MKLSFDMSRIMKHFKDKNFGIISAYKGNSKLEDIKKQKELKEDLRSKGFGFQEMKGVWGGGFEHSIFIPYISSKEIKDLGNKYDQEAVIYTDKESVILDFLKTNEKKTFSKLDINKKENWETWSKFRRHEFKFSNIVNKVIFKINEDRSKNG